MADIECEHCGGTDFYKESGFFFCRGCQIQSQELREYAFEEFGFEDTRARTKKVTSEKKEKNDKITSWECYNYVLLGLTQELINLGASKELKSVVKCLWLRYLEKMGVFKPGKNQLPQLQAVCSAIDAEIVYGRVIGKKRKRRKSSSSETNTTTVGSVSTRQEKVKKKRALLKAQYEDFSQKSHGTSSVHNETLTSLQTTSDKSSKSGVNISYNIHAARELRRLYKSRYHSTQHRKDVDRNLKCHRANYRQISNKYRKSPYLLSLNKLYSILYLGLLIIKDKIQLSDLLRFIREGKLSFNCYSHFFPEDFSDKILNFKNFSKNRVFSNTQLRFMTSEMSTFLETDFYISCPNLVELCERYCKELNLPKSIYSCAIKLLSKSNINMSFRKRITRVPNYEGRVLSLIIFILKLLFGLDDVTEFSLGNYATILNKNKSIDRKMFDIVDWLKFIEYRDLVMTQEHLPSSFTKTPNLDIAVGFLSAKQYPETKFNKNKDKYKQLLTKLKSELHEPTTQDFPDTLTPFWDNSKLFKDSKYCEIISKDFGEDSLDHILKPTQFLEAFNDNVEISHGGANEDWIFEKPISTTENLKNSLIDRRKLITVKFNFDSSKKTRIRSREIKIDPEEIKSNFYAANEAKFKRNLQRFHNKEISVVEDLDFETIQEELKKENYKKHYNPYERFWLRIQANIEYLNYRDFHNFYEKFPKNFRLVFEECMRIAQQNERELLIEYQMTELYLVYLANYDKKQCKVIKDSLLLSCLNKSSDLW